MSEDIIGIDVAYHEACRQLGDAMVRETFMQRALDAARAEAAEAGARIVELTRPVAHDHHHNGRASADVHDQGDTIAVPAKE